MIVRYTRRAERDLAFILSHLEARSPSGAIQVATHLRASTQFLAENPRGGMATRNPDLFVKLVPKYPYKIFYRLQQEVVEIVHIRHASRRPWLK
jgi:toxin ParE1/3/4